MATFTWIGGGSDLFETSTDWSPTGPPIAGDTAIVAISATSLFVNNTTLTDNTITVTGSNDTLSLNHGLITGVTLTASLGFNLIVTDGTIADASVQVGNNATISLTGDISTPGTVGTNFLTKSGGGGDHNQSQLTEAGAGASVVLNAAGTVEDNGILFADSNGGSFTVNQTSAAGGTVAGYFILQGALIAEPGDPVTVNRDAGSVFANDSGIIIAGGSLALNAQLDTTSGEITVASGTASIDTLVPFSQHLLFDDAAGVLTLAATETFTPGGPSVLGGFAAGIGGFQAGDSITLTGVSPTGLVFASEGGVLTLDQGGAISAGTISGGTVLGTLRFQGGQFVDGTGTVGGANSTDFAITSDGSGDAVITTSGTDADWNGVSDGATTDWSASNWTGGSGAGGIPGTLQTAVIANNSVELSAFKNYVLTVSSAETAGSVVLDDHFVELTLTAPLTLRQAAGQTSGGDFLGGGGSVDIAAGGTLTATRLIAPDKLLVETGGTLAVSGAAPAAAQSGFTGVDVENSASITGGVVTGGTVSIRGTPEPVHGSFIIGQNASGGVTESGGTVIASYTQIGGQPQGSGQLDISGAGTSWQDVGDAANPGDAGVYLGDMVVGGGAYDPDGSVPVGGFGNLTVDMGATLSEAGAAMLGVTGSDPSLPSPAPTSSGFAQVQNSATWDIGTFLNIGGSYRYSGALPGGGIAFGGVGNLNVFSGGQVQLGSAETSGQYKVTLATTPGSSGQLFVQGNGSAASSLDTGGGAIAIGEAAGGAGMLNVSSGGSVTAGAATPGIGWGAVVGDAGATGTLGVASGMVMVGGGGGASMFTVNGAMVDGNAGQGQMFVDAGGSLLVQGTLSIGEAAGSSGALTINNGATAMAGAAVPGVTRGVVLGDAGESGLLGPAAGSLTVGGGGVGNALFIVNGDLVDGNGGLGTLFMASGGTVTVSATLFVGGVTGPGAGGTLSGGGGTLTAAAAVIWQGSTLNAGAGGIVAIGGASTNEGIDVAAGATISGAGTISGNLDDDGVVVADVAGKQLVQNSGSITGAGTLMMRSDATLDIVTNSNYSNSVAFSGGGDVLTLQVPTALQGAISGFGLNDTIDLPGAVFPPAQTLNYDGTAGVLHFGADAFHLGTEYKPSNFAIQKEPAGNGSEIVFVPCFAAGARILTGRGEVAVEALRAGEIVPTLAGGLRTVVWIGRTRVDLDRHPQPERAAPIRVQAHAFGPAMPHRSLLLSPDHAVWLDDALVPIHLLVNGASIAREPGAGAVDYFHVELDRHAVLLAEGLPAESYLDTGNRGLFSNAAGVRAVHPDLTARAWDERACAVLLLGGARVAACHRRLLQRAETLGHALTDDPAIRLFADGVAVVAERPEPGLLRALLPAGTRLVRIRSLSGVPDEFDRVANDRRRLGVAVASVRLDGQALDDAGFTAGFHAPEADAGRTWRWTDGDALLRLEPEDQPRVLELRLHTGWRRYWVAMPVATAEASA